MSLYRAIIDFKQSLMGGDPAQLALPSFGSQAPELSASGGLWDALLGWLRHDANITSDLLGYKSQFSEEDDLNDWLGDDKVPVILIDQSNTYVVLLDSDVDDTKTLVKIVAGENTQSGESSGGSPNVQSEAESLFTHSLGDSFDFKPILVGFDGLSDLFSQIEGWGDFSPMIVPVPPGEVFTPPAGTSSEFPIPEVSCSFAPTVFYDGFDQKDGQLTLREAIELANNNRNGVDTICLDFGTYTMGIQSTEGFFGEGFVISEDLIIHGAGTENTFIDASWISPIFELLGNVSLMLQDLTLIYGQTNLYDGVYLFQSTNEFNSIVSPIVLDMNGDGAKLASVSGSQPVSFDADGDGIQDVMKSWVSPEDAFLVFDENGDGRVSGVHEISFTHYSSGAKTDLEGLREAFDSNSDNVLDSQDSQFDHFGTWKPFRKQPTFLCANMNHLPFKSQSVDVIFSNFTLQWGNSLKAIFAEFKRVLSPKGMLFFTTLGPQTLFELRQSFAKVDDAIHVHTFWDMHDIGDLLLNCPFTDPVVDIEMLTISYREISSLLTDLKGTGANNLDPSRRQGCTTQPLLKRMLRAYEDFKRPDSLYPATFEVIYGHARNDAPMLHKQNKGLITIPADKIPQLL